MCTGLQCLRRGIGIWTPLWGDRGILTLHLAKRLQQCAEDNVYGVSAIAAAGGQGTAILWKKVCEK